MASFVRRAGELSQKVLPTYKAVYRKVKPQVVNTSRYVAKRLGPPLQRSSRYLLNAARPHVQRYDSLTTSVIAAKLEPHTKSLKESFNRRLLSVAPGLSVTRQTEALTEGQVPEAAPEEEDDFRERYIPLTRKSVIRQLMQKEDFLTAEEKKYYEDFTLSLDSAIVNKYNGVLQELKNLFDPINPDKDTIETRKWNPRERQDSEFWLLQRLEDLMEKANFHELPQPIVERAMQEHEVGDGIRVAVDTTKYDVLKFWALGREKIPVTLPWYRALFQRPKTVKPKLYYKRIVVAIRFKRDQKLILKSFKEIPVNSLEMILPDGKLKIGKFDKRIFTASVTLATLGVIAKVVTVLASMNVDWTLMMTGVTGLLAAQRWTSYKNKRNQYLADLSRLLYFKNVANNRGLLALLVDRAEDETFKQALLVYTFLLANRPASMLDQRSLEMSPNELGGLSRLQLEERVEQYIYKVTGTQVEVDSAEAIMLLKKFGIVSEQDDKLHVLPLKAAMRNLPQQPQSLVARASEGDIAEGYDRDVFAETEEQYEKEEQVQKRVGWF
ncbi:transmembrane protein 143-like isoform X1 [Dreissena polymorpha]|uniref:transmembrane protein 143-like isoform X1 n=1 Tax=Dreissena polymorpha TaxID=45954 RepID=UPI002264C890|nr:transmembrane protein 143-like isoform X1 [Dreissena polymorpha]